MANLVPVDHDPFGEASTGGQTLKPVDHDPFATAAPAPDAAHAEARTYLNAHPELQHQTGHQLAGKFFQGATLGYGDEAMAGLRAAKDWVTHGAEHSPSHYYEREKAMQDELMKGATEDTGALGTAAEIAGSLAPGGLIAKGVGKVVANPLAQSVATGSGMGAVQASGDGGNILEGAAGGAAGGAVGHGLGRLIGRVATGGPKIVEPPSTQSFKDAATTAYNDFENAGGRFTEEGAKALKLALDTKLQGAGYVPGFSPKVDAVLRAVDTAHAASQGQGMTPRMMQAVRQAAGKVRGSIDPTERSFGHELVGGIDDFIANAQPHHYNSPNSNGLAGHLPGVSDLSNSLKDANKNYQTFSKADLIDQAQRSAQQQAERTGSGGNIGNATRQKVGKLIDKRRDWTPEELAALEKVSAGSTVQNIARNLGKLSPEGNGLMQAINIGSGIASGGASIPLTALGFGAKRLSDKMTNDSVSNLSRIVRNGGTAPAKVNVQPSDIEAFLSRNPTLLAQGIMGAKQQ